METKKHDYSDGLIPLVTNVLIKLNHNRPNDWVLGLHPDAKSFMKNDFTPAVLDIQRFLINRHLRYILGTCTAENTMDARYCLVDKGDLDNWLRLIETGVAPTLVKHNLPQAIN